MSTCLGQSELFPPDRSLFSGEATHCIILSLAKTRRVWVVRADSGFYRFVQVGLLQANRFSRGHVLDL